MKIIERTEPPVDVLHRETVLLNIILYIIYRLEYLRVMNNDIID